jgi:hypothetical protein
MDHPPVRDDEAGDPWVIPLHGIEAPVKAAARSANSTDDDTAVTAHFYSDDDLPTVEFRPRLRRSA